MVSMVGFLFWVPFVFCGGNGQSSPSCVSDCFEPVEAKEDMEMLQHSESVFDRQQTVSVHRSNAAFSYVIAGTVGASGPLMSMTHEQALLLSKQPGTSLITQWRGPSFPLQEYLDECNKVVNGDDVAIANYRAWEKHRQAGTMGVSDVRMKALIQHAIGIATKTRWYAALKGLVGGALRVAASSGNPICFFVVLPPSAPHWKEFYPEWYYTWVEDWRKDTEQFLKLKDVIHNHVESYADALKRMQNGQCTGLEGRSPQPYAGGHAKNTEHQVNPLEEPDPRDKSRQYASGNAPRSRLVEFNHSDSLEIKDFEF